MSKVSGKTYVNVSGSCRLALAAKVSVILASSVLFTLTLALCYIVEKRLA